MKRRIIRKSIMCVIFFALLVGGVVCLQHYKNHFINPVNLIEEPINETKDETPPLQTEESQEGRANLPSLPVESIPATIETEVCENRVSVVACGDNLVHQNVLNYANRLAGGDGSTESYQTAGFDFIGMYGNIQNTIYRADLSILNQTSLVGANDSPGALSGYPLFNTPSEMGDDLVEMGFDVINIANNHMLDMSSGGLNNSILYWKTKDVFLAGGYRNQAEFSDINNKILDVNGIKIALLSYTASTNGLYSNTKEGYIPYFLSDKGEIYQSVLETQVKEACELSDCVVVLIYWGTEGGYEPSAIQQETARILTEAGADVIIGTGPKVIQKAEWISTEDGARSTLCAYSLGNLICTMQYMDNLLGGILSFDIIKESEEGRGVIKNVLFSPTVIHYDKNFSEIEVFPLEKYTEELFLVHGSNLNFGFGKFSWYKETVLRYIPKEFLSAALRSS